MTYPSKRTTPYNPGRQLVDGQDVNNIFDAFQSSQQLNPAGAVSQAAATAINGAQIEILAGAAASSVLLPPSYPGAEINILNNSSNSQQVYGSGADVVQTTGTTYAAAATGVVLVTLAAAKYFCIKTGFWQRLVTA